MLAFRNAGLRDVVAPTDKKAATKQAAAKKATKRAPRPYCIALKGPTGNSLGYITEIPVIRTKGGIPETYSTALARMAAEKKAAAKAAKKKVQ